MPQNCGKGEKIMKLREEQTFGIARKIKANMTGESWEHITHSVVSYEADVTELMPLIKKMNEGATKENKITVNSVMLKIITEGIKVMPLINSHLEFNRKLVRGTLKVFDTINISIPMVLPTGEMMTVNLRDMEKKSISEMDKAVKETVKKAQNSDINEALYGVSFNDTITGLKKGKVLQAARRLYGSKMPGKHKVKTLGGEEKKRYYAIPESERLSQKDLEQGTITVSNLGSVYREGTQRCYMLQIVPPRKVSGSWVSRFQISPSLSAHVRRAFSKLSNTPSNEYHLLQIKKGIHYGRLIRIFQSSRTLSITSYFACFVFQRT